MKWSTACPDWEERIVAGESLVPIVPLFPDQAEDALSVFCALQVTDMPRKADGSWPTLGEIVDQDVLDLVAAIFGAYDPKTGQRLIREFMLLISKKNGKSTIAAGIMLTALILNWRHTAELLILAPTLEVAKNSFDPAKGMVDADPELQKLLHVVEHQRLIRHRVTKAELKIIAADSDTSAGKKAGMVLIEELWLFGKKPKSAAMLREAIGGLSARPEGFVLYISTHSDEPPAGVFKGKLQYFRDVRDGEIADPTSLGVLYEWPSEMLEDQSYLEPENFHVTNPHLGRSVTKSWLEGELIKEQRGDGEGLQIFLAKHLNVEIGLRLRRDRWRGADVWDKSVEPALRDLDTFLARCEVAVAGFDGGGDDDLSGLCLLGRDRESGEWIGWFRAWVHYTALDLRKEIAPALKDFATDGDLVIWGEPGSDSDGSGDFDIEQIADLIADVWDRGLMPEEGALGVDAAGLGTLLDALKERDIPVEKAVWSVSQGFRLTGLIYAVQRKLWSGQLTHGGSKMMAWCVSNAKAEQKGNSVVITKQAAGKAKIDPVIALFNAAKMMERSPEAGGATVSTEDWLSGLAA